MITSNLGYLGQPQILNSKRCLLAGDLSLEDYEVLPGGVEIRLNLGLTPI